MKIEIEILKIVIIMGSGMDYIQLYTTLPQSINSCRSKQIFEFKAAAGSGVEYVQKYFKINPHILEI